LQQAIGNVPLVFAGVIDPVASGLVASLARPGGNATGFASFEYSIAGKYLELLKEIAPRLTRVAVLRDPTAPGGTGQFGAIQAVAPSLGVEASPLDVRQANDIEPGVAAFARTPNGGLILLGGARATVHRELIISLAARHRLPAAYSNRVSVAAGGLISYGPINPTNYRLAASYVNRILRGEKPADLPVQLPTKFEMAVNAETAKALGLTVPQSILLRADEVIE
jgi:putative ABC transport system substrate-binding protein